MGRGVTVGAFARLDVVDKVGALSDPACPVEVIRTGAGAEDWWVRRAAVGNPGAPEDVIRGGAGDAELRVRMAAVRNPGAPVDVIRAGAVDHSPWVRAAVAGNANAPEELIAVAVRDRNLRSFEVAWSIRHVRGSSGLAVVDRFS